MSLSSFLNFLKWNENDNTVEVKPWLFDDKNPFIQALERKKARKLVKRVRTWGELSPEEIVFLQGEQIPDSHSEWISANVVAIQDTTADMIANVLSQLWDQPPRSWESLLTQNTLQEVQIDRETRIWVPKFLRTTNLYSSEVDENGTIRLSSITKEILKKSYKLHHEI